MSIKQSQSRRKQWASISKEERSRIISDRIKKMWAKKTKAQRQAHSLKMQVARLKKQKKDVAV